MLPGMHWSQVGRGQPGRIPQGEPHAWVSTLLGQGQGSWLISYAMVLNQAIRRDRMKGELNTPERTNAGWGQGAGLDKALGAGCGRVNTARGVMWVVLGGSSYRGAALAQALTQHGLEGSAWCCTSLGQQHDVPALGKSIQEFRCHPNPGRLAEQAPAPFLAFPDPRTCNHFLSAIHVDSVRQNRAKAGLPGKVH